MLLNRVKNAVPKGHGVWVFSANDDNTRLRGMRLREVDVPDMGAYSHFLMDTLLKHPSVQDCKTSFVLDQVKATTALPV